MSKSKYSGTAKFAQGGPVMGKQSEFMKTPDRFRGEENDPNNFGKSTGGKANPTPKNKMAGHGPNCTCAACS